MTPQLKLKAADIPGLDLDALMVQELRVLQMRVQARLTELELLQDMRRALVEHAGCRGKDGTDALTLPEIAALFAKAGLKVVIQKE